jgi:hypothetical protein
MVMKGAGTAKLGGWYDPGHFLFDYFNVAQLSDLAQNLGSDPTVGREVVREGSGNASVKFSVKVFEVNKEGVGKLSETRSFAGSLPTALLIEVLARLNRSDEEGRLIRLSRTSMQEMINACEHAAKRRTFVILEGQWVVEGDDPYILRYIPDNSMQSVDAVEISMEIPARAEEFTPSGRARIKLGKRIEAAAFAQPETWDQQERRFNAIAHAVFARLGDPKFEWDSARLWSSGDSSDGDF